MFPVAINEAVAFKSSAGDFVDSKNLSMTGSPREVGLV